MNTALCILWGVVGLYVGFICGEGWERGKQKEQPK
jgi:uncharacterized protein YneF (UPF0154 family)